MRHSVSASDRTDTTAIDVRFRSLSQLRDTCAERQTIRIEYYAPNQCPKTSQKPTAPCSTMTYDSLDPPKGVCTGQVGMGAVKSIEITTERNTGTALKATTDSTFTAQNSTSETQQGEQSSEARQDNGTWIGIAVVIAVAALLYFSIKEALT